MNDVIKYAATERLYVAQFGGTLIDDERQWKIDADVLTLCGKTVSIKDQLKSSAKYGNLAIGVEMSNPRNGATKPDWFGYINTTGCALLCTHPQTKEAIWIRCTPEKLKAWVKDNASKLRKFNLQPSTVQHNEQQGRTYTDGWGYLVPVQSLLDGGFQFTVLNQHYNTQ